MNVRNVFLTDRLSHLFMPFFVFTFQLSYKLVFPITSMYGSIFTAWRILEVMREESAISDWLASVESLLPITTAIPVHVFLLLAYLLVEDKGRNLRQILKVTTEFAQADSSQVKHENNGAVMGVKLNIGIVDYSFIVDNFYQSFRVQVAFFFCYLYFPIFFFFLFTLS